MTPEEQAAWDDERAKPDGLMFDGDGKVIFDAGNTGFKTKADVEAHQAELAEKLAEYRANKAKAAE
jgi:hypothetical protein